MLHFATWDVHNPTTIITEHETVFSEAHKAIENVEDYCQTLTRHGNEELRTNLERVITTFKSNLMHSLLDIHDLYEQTLLSERKSDAEKNMEVRRVIERLEGGPHSYNSRPAATTSTSNYNLSSTTPLISDVSSAFFFSLDLDSRFF